MFNGVLSRHIQVMWAFRARETVFNGVLSRHIQVTLGKYQINQRSNKMKSFHEWQNCMKHSLLNKSIEALLCIKGDQAAFTLTATIIEPRCEKTGLQGFRPGLTQTGLCSHR